MSEPGNRPPPDLAAEAASAGDEVARPSVEQLERILGRDHGGTCGAAAEPAKEPTRIMVALSSQAAETLRALFFHGPTWDGYVPSKTGRDELVDLQLVARGRGWQWLTRTGVEACLNAGLEREKVSREFRERDRRSKLEDAARQILS